jgi:uncharacterized protein with GYD domain
MLIEALPGKVETVLSHIKKIESVRKAFMVFGRFDIVAFIEAPDYEAMRKLSLEVNAIEGVEQTETIVEA